MRARERERARAFVREREVTCQRRVVTRSNSTVALMTAAVMFNNREQRECQCLCCSVKRRARHALALAINTRCVQVLQPRAVLIPPHPNPLHTHVTSA
jgi:hypothetical protein